MRAVVILNASAGQGSASGRLEEVRSRLEAAGIEATIGQAHEGGGIQRQVDDALASGAQLVVAGGGDGTISAVAARLAGKPATLGVLPLGTLNHFAKDLGIPLQLEAAIDTIAHGRVQEVDLAEVNGRVFINNSSIGLYPDIVLDRERQRRRLGRGKWRALLAASVHAARDIPALTVRIESADGAIVRQTPFVFVGNNVYTMEGFSIGARERLDAGQLSLYMTQRTGRFALLRLALRALFHRLDQARDFDVTASPSFVVHTPSARERVATDGEVVLVDTPLRYRVLPRALRVIVPRPAA